MAPKAYRPWLKFWHCAEVGTSDMAMQKASQYRNMVSTEMQEANLPVQPRERVA
jgi:hypothetical protein